MGRLYRWRYPGRCPLPAPRCTVPRVHMPDGRWSCLRQEFALRRPCFQKLGIKRRRRRAVGASWVRTRLRLVPFDRRTVPGPIGRSYVMYAFIVRLQRLTTSLVLLRQTISGCSRRTRLGLQLPLSPGRRCLPDAKLS